MAKKEGPKPIKIQSIWPSQINVQCKPLAPQEVRENVVKDDEINALVVNKYIVIIE